jgi:gliding motility-associated-like protein
MLKAFRISLQSILLLLLSFGSASATHLYGGELYYTYVSGNKYTVTMVMYADCSGAASLLTTLYTASPRVDVFNGTTLYRTMSLKVLSGAGTEVTPVCSASIGSTTCNGGTVPGVRRFAYSDTITLSPSALWKFKSTGYITASSSAGRSSTISNISSPGTSIMSLEASLNNSVQPNSNPTYTTVPTPFFCINVAQEYNPGAVDPNTGDSLVYDLVDAIDAKTTPYTLVTYLTGYSATAPLACKTGTYSFSNSTGQLSFTPNLTQVSLVVCRVSEYRSGVLVGTSMREMNFIVISSCSNRSPYGKITGVSAGKAVDNTTVEVCKNESFLSFNINPIDSDGNNITVSVAGLPSGATLAISGSGTAAPTTTFSWNISAVASGTYYFFITYQDDGCPLSSKQTVAYTINILPKPTFIVNLISGATCVKKAVFDVQPTSSGSPWSLKVFSGASLLHTISGGLGTIRDSLAPGTYTLRLTNTSGCFEDLLYSINPPPQITIASLSTVKPKCIGSADGSVSITAAAGLAPYNYSLDAAAYTASGSFSGISAGSHTIRIMDANFCTKDTAFVLLDPDPILIQSFSSTLPLCVGSADGTVSIVATNTVAPYTYRIDAGAFISPGNFTGLLAGTHTIRIKDAYGCTKDTTFVLANPSPVTIATFIKRPLCNGTSDGSVSLLAIGGTGPYTYSIGATGIFVASNLFAGLASGTYTFKAKDAHNCIQSISVTVLDSIAIKTSFILQNISCFGGSDGSITLNPTIGLAPFSYAKGTGGYVGSNAFSGLTAGTYTFKLKDANGCTADTFASVTQPALLTLKLSLKTPSCFGAADGLATLIPSGGTAPYQYALNANPYGIVASFGSLAAGTYAFHVKDANGCIKDTSITIAQPSKLLITNVVFKMPLCHGGSDGAISLTGTGGTPTYTYAYDAAPAQVASTLTGLKSANYVLHLIDQNGCTKDTTVFLSEPTALTFKKIIITEPTCEGYADGSVLFVGSGATAPYKYAIPPTVYLNDSLFTKLKEGTYTLSIQDSNHCQVDATIKLVGYPKIIFDSTRITTPTCFGLLDGAFQLYASGGNAPLRYTLFASADTANTASYAQLKSATYIVTVIDTTNCHKDFSVYVAQPDKLSIHTDVVPNDCIGLDTNGRISAVVTGGTSPYTYWWSTNSRDAAIAQLPNGFYSVKVADTHNCSDSVTAEVRYDNCCTPSIPNAFTPNNDGKNDLFKILYKGDIVLKEFSIYNRYGQQVFTTTDVLQGWNGQFNGKDELMGVYYYFIRMLCGNEQNNEMIFKGDVTLIR